MRNVHHSSNNPTSDKLNTGYGQRPVVLPSAPRTLTQAQIYTINEIMKNSLWRKDLDLLYSYLNYRKILKSYTIDNTMFNDYFQTTTITNTCKLNVKLQWAQMEFHELQPETTNSRVV